MCVVLCLTINYPVKLLMLKNHRAMSYKIYELVKPEILKKTEPDLSYGYHIKTTELIVIKEADCSGLDWSYNSELEARTAIMANRYDLRHKDLIVLNVMSVKLDGEVS